MPCIVTLLTANVRYNVSKIALRLTGASDISRQEANEAAQGYRLAFCAYRITIIAVYLSQS